ncbi:MAG: DNA repair protein RecN [Acinetobacter sp.]|jgi:DNA repair protein RecN (Recombination protein N)|nr:MAG: DNA repair protein RecN [Acinetobacter sp.]
MLNNISLHNFALADQLAIDIESGFNVLTGETGAGKSLLLDALSACLGERSDASQVRFGHDKAEVIATFSYREHSPEADWLKEHELLDESGEIIIRRVIFANGRSKAWINGRPTSMSELKTLGRLLVLLYSQHSQQQLLDPPYPKQWLDRYAGLQQQALTVKHAYQHWQKSQRLYQDARDAQYSRAAKLEQLQQQLEDLEPLLDIHYQDIEQEYDRLSHHESMMQDCHTMLHALDEGEQNILQELAAIVRKAEAQHARSPQLEQVHNTLLNAQSELEDATSHLKQFIDRQSFDPERMSELNTQLEQFHRLARKYRTQPHELLSEYQNWQQQLEQLQELENPEQLAAQVEQAQQHFLELAEQLNQTRLHVAIDVAAQLTTQVKPLALPEAHFEFRFEPLDEPNADGISFIQLLFTANKGIPAQPLARVASGGELSRIALVMQVMNASKTDAEVLVFDEIDVGISGGTAEIVGRLLADLAQHVQILCITHQAQVAAQSDQHLLVKKQQTNPASSTIISLDEPQRIDELARMSGGVEINATTLQHAKQLRDLKFIKS